MADYSHITWINWVAAFLGGLILAVGLTGFSEGNPLFDSFLLVFGVLILGWSIFDSRRRRRGNPESTSKGETIVE